MKKKNQRNPKSRSWTGPMELEMPLEILKIKDLKQITNVRGTPLWI